MILLDSLLGCSLSPDQLPYFTAYITYTYSALFMSPSAALVREVDSSILVHGIEEIGCC